jgi:membrane protein implicated in regulation of membrane protease activity
LKTRLEALLFALLLFGLAPSMAEAYLDPGTGSLVLQSATAAIISVGFALRVCWRRFREKLRSPRRYGR